MLLPCSTVHWKCLIIYMSSTQCMDLCINERNKLSDSLIGGRKRIFANDVARTSFSVTGIFFSEQHTKTVFTFSAISPKVNSM